MDTNYGLVHDFIKQHELFSGNEKNILIGLSGGADSVCLLFMLKELKLSGILPNTELIAAHLNHGIRGDEAVRDEEFVRELCKREGVRLFVKRQDIPRIARELSESEESTGRRLRYEFFREILKQEGGGLIATAHHKNDLAETVLMNISRGTGLTGLAGIRAKQKDVARPLLCLTRKQIESYVEDRGLSFVNDSTNEEDIYTRNFLRNRIVPLFEENVNTGFVEHIYRLSETARRADEYLEAQAEKLFSRCEVNGECITVPCADIAKEESILREYLYRRIICEVSGSSRDFSQERTAAVDEILLDMAEGKRSGKLIELPHGVRVFSERGVITFTKYSVDISPDKPGSSQRSEAVSQNCNTDDFCIKLMSPDIRKRLEAGDTVHLRFGEFDVRLTITENFIKNADSDYTKFFDYDKINDTACLRYADKADYMIVTKDGKRHSLKQELKNKKIPSAERGSVLVMAQGSECLWAVGVRRGMSALVEDTARRFLRITFSL